MPQLLLTCSNTLKVFCASLVKTTNACLTWGMRENVNYILFSGHFKLCRISYHKLRTTCSSNVIS